MHLRNPIIVLLALFVQTGLASVVTKLGGSGKAVLITQDATPFKTGDRVCLFAAGKDKPHACGNISKTNEKAAILNIDKSIAPAAIGNIARLSRVQHSETSATKTSETKTARVAIARRSYADRKFALGVGPLGNWNFLIASLHFQFAATQNIAVGLLPIFVSSGATNKVTDFGGLLTLNYYGGTGPFSGLWISLGAGMHFLSLEGPNPDGTTATESAKAISAIGTIGYRHRFNDTFHAGLGLGGLYTNESTTIFTLSFNGTKPIVLADIGITF